MNKTFCIFVSILTLNLGGCASIVSGKNDMVRFNSTPSGANISIQDENGKNVYRGTTPTTVTLERGDGFFDGQSYNIDYSAPGYEPKTYHLDTTMNSWYLGNLAAGGLVGMLLVDPATGAMWNLPESVDVNLTPVNLSNVTAPALVQAPEKQRVRSKTAKHKRKFHS